MATRDYSSVHTIKEFIHTELAPKYYNLEEINQLYTGLYGLTTDAIATVTEDAFNTLSLYTREIFPNIAELPETLYSNAVRLQIDQLMATPSKMDIILFVDEKDIMTKGQPLSDGRVQFMLDSELIVDVEGKQFMLDYDINITAKMYRGDLIFTAMYDMTYENSISRIVNPYVRTRRVRYNNDKLLGLMVSVHQVNRFEKTETLITSERVNLPTLTFDYTDQLANFEVLYRPPGSNRYTQLAKKVFNSPPSKEPFCYYRLRNENTVEISFTLRENYFQPQFGSEIFIRYFTTTGSAGDFPLYTGNGFEVIPKSETYDYNNNLIMRGIAQSASVGGRPRLSLEELRSKIVELTSTSGSYSTESDLQVYFNSNKNVNGTEVLFVKRRDDALERLFSAFSLFKDDNGDIYPTNTLNLEMKDYHFDAEYDVSGRYVFKPGHLFRYKGNSVDIIEPIRNVALKDLSTLTDEFVYTNPFLMVITKSPGVVGYYLNSIKSEHILDYSYINDRSPFQFITNNLTVSRNAIKGEDFYTIRITVMPAMDEDMGIVDESGNLTGRLKLKGTIKDVDGTESCMFDFNLVNADNENGFYTFEAKLTTDDYMTTAEKFRVKQVYDLTSFETIDKVVPMVSAKLNLHVFYKYADVSSKVPHVYDNNAELQPFTLTNTYSTEDQTVDFITPVNMMRSQIKYIQNITEDPNEPNHYMRVSFVPFIRASVMQDETKYSGFIKQLYLQYQYLKNIVDRISNNFGVDMKFYKTYGRSKNFTIGETGQTLDKVNISIRFQVFPVVGTVEADLIRDLKAFIKNFVEGINTTGYNHIFVSNLIKEIENNFSEVDYLKFVRINNYDSSTQVIRNRGINIDNMTKEERREYVPEYLTITLDDISIEILSN